MATVFDVIKHATVTKTNWSDLSEEEQKAFNKWMFQKVLSMNADYVDVVNIIQRHSWQLEDKLLYLCYKNILPKRSAYAKYIKNTQKKEYKLEEVEAISSYYEISQKEAKGYIDQLDDKVIKEITSYYEES